MGDVGPVADVLFFWLAPQQLTSKIVPRPDGGPEPPEKQAREYGTKIATIVRQRPAAT